MIGIVIDNEGKEIKINTDKDQQIRNDIYCHRSRSGNETYYRQTVTGFEFLEKLPDQEYKIDQSPEFGGISIQTDDCKIYMQSGEYYTYEGAAKVLNISYHTVRSQVSVHGLGIKIGSTTLLSGSDVQILKGKARKNR